MAIDVEALLAEVSAESPCGEDMSYEPAYSELEMSAQGTPERQVGDTIVPAEEPDWRAVREKSVALLAQTKDLRITLYLAQSLVRTEGIPGFRDGMAVMRGIVERYWQEMHPQLDPDDDFDPMERVNILTGLAPPVAEQDPPLLFKLLETCELCVSPILHRSFNLRDVRIAKGELPPPPATGQDDQAPATLTEVRAAFTGEKLNEAQQAELTETLQATARAAGEAVEHLDVLDSLLTQYLGADKKPNLNVLQGMVTEVAACVNEYLAERGQAVEGLPTGGAAPAAAAEGAAPAPGAGPAIAGEIRSPDDVVRVFDKICEYYKRFEPSSPVPLLVEHAKRLVRKDFMSIMQDLTPDQVRQIATLLGVQEEQQQY